MRQLIQIQTQFNYQPVAPKRWQQHWRKAIAILRLMTLQAPSCMPNVMAGIYSSFSANRDERRRPRSRECQLFSRLSVYFVEVVSRLCETKKERKSNKNAKERRRANFSRFRVSKTTATRRKARKTVEKGEKKTSICRLPKP